MKHLFQATRGVESFNTWKIEMDPDETMPLPHPPEHERERERESSALNIVGCQGFKLEYLFYNSLRKRERHFQPCLIDPQTKNISVPYSLHYQ